MKRQSLFNRIISLSIIATLYLTMSGSAYAELNTEVPATEQVVSENETTVTEETAQEQSEAKDAEESSLESQVDIAEEDVPKVNDGIEPKTDTSENSKPIVDKIVDAIDSILPDTEKKEDAADKENKKEDTKSEDTKSEDTKAEDTKSEDTKAEDTKSEDTKSDDTKPNDTKSGETDKVSKNEKAKEHQPGDTYFEIVKSEDGTQIKATYEYVLNEDTGELEAVLIGEQEGFFDEEGNLIEKKKCDHEFIYTSNKDGTHSVKCKNCELEEYTETCTYDENEVCKYCGHKRPPEPLLVYEDDEVIVRVSGAVPENADLKVTPIKKDIEETKDAFEQVEQKLIDETDIEEHDAYGFLAYDISFISQETNEEIEPSGDVTVTLEYKSAVVPVSDVDISQVEAVETSLVHFNEQTEQIENLTELNKAELGMTDSKAISNATFTSSSFSTYVITWVADAGKINVKLNVKNIDKKANAEIPNSASITLNVSEDGVGEIKFDKGDEIFAQTMNSLTDYSLIEVRYGEDIVTSAKYTTSKSGNYYYYRVTFYNGTEEVAHKEVERKKNANEKSLELDVVAYYKQNSNLSVSKIATGIYREDTVTDYYFTLLDANGNPVADEGYTIGDNPFNTDGEGKFTLKSGQKAEFEALPDGTYTIKETGLKNTSVPKLSLKDFITKVYVGEVKEDNKQAEFDTEDSNRTLTMNVSSETKPQVVFKNLYTNTTTELQQEEVSKFIKYNGFDKNGVETYRINFKFDSPKETITTTVFDEDAEETITDSKVNIVLLFDKSYSMTTGGRLDKAVAAVNTMVNSFKAKEHVDAIWSVVDFSATATIRTNGGWVGTDTVLDYVDKKHDYGTNYDAALHYGAQLASNLPADRAGSKTIVVFLTDGQPTARGGYGDNELVNRSRLTQGMIDAAVASSKEIKCDAFFAIGVGLTTYPIYHETQNYTVGDPVKGRDILETIVAAVKEKNNLNEDNAKINTVEDDDLEKLFIDIVGHIETILHPDNHSTVVTNYAKNVHMQDKLSDNVKAKEGSEYYISVQMSEIGEDGKPRMVDLQDKGRGKWEGLSGYIGGRSASYEIYEGDKTYILTAEYNPSSKTFELKFPEGYVLDKGYSYSVSFEVTPTDDTYDAHYPYKDNPDMYPNEGDEGTDNLSDGPETGTSAFKKGYFSNDHDGSYVEFDLGDKRPKDYFPMPVVQVHYINVWEIIKTDDTGTKKLSNAAFTLTENGNDEGLKYSGATAYEDDKLGLLVWTLGEDEKIAVSKEYILTEVATPSGYVKSDEIWKIKLDNENKPTVEIKKEGDSDEAYKSYETFYGVVTPKQSGRYITYSYYFKNFPMDESYDLPQTGGRGTYSTTGFGLALMLTSAFLFYRNKKRTKTFTSTNN